MLDFVYGSINKAFMVMQTFILSLFIVHKSLLKSKLEKLFAGGITKNGLLKPTLGIQLWGPWFIMFEIDVDADTSADPADPSGHPEEGRAVAA